jgi:hypothetical protein
MMTIIKKTLHAGIAHRMHYACMKIFIIIVIMCGAGDAVKIVTFFLNCQLFKTKVQLFTQNSLPCGHASNTKQQK